MLHVSTPEYGYFFILYYEPTNVQLFHKLSHIFRHYCVVLRDTSTSNLNFKLYYQQLHLKYLCNLARYWLRTR